jgi:hypothetical protein
MAYSPLSGSGSRPAGKVEVPPLRKCTRNCPGNLHKDGKEAQPKPKPPTQPKAPVSCSIQLVEPDEVEVKIEGPAAELTYQDEMSVPRGVLPSKASTSSASGSGPGTPKDPARTLPKAKANAPPNESVPPKIRTGRCGCEHWLPLPLFFMSLFKSLGFIHTYI